MAVTNAKLYWPVCKYCCSKRPMRSSGRLSRWRSFPRQPHTRSSWRCLCRTCHPAIQSSRTNLGRRRPGVVGAALYNDRLGISSVFRHSLQQRIIIPWFSESYRYKELYGLESQYLNYQDQVHKLAIVFMYYTTGRCYSTLSSTL